MEELIIVCENVGIDARGKTIGQIKREYYKKRNPNYSDQFDVAFEQYIKIFTSMPQF